MGQAAWLVTEHKISTHAPAGGATFSLPRPTSCLERFLLTPLREGRLVSALRGVDELAFISTHAPAGGATEKPRRKIKRKEFLLTPLREGRPGPAGSH